MFFECRIVEMDKEGKRTVIAGISAIPVTMGEKSHGSASFSDESRTEIDYVIAKLLQDAAWNKQHQKLDSPPGSEITIQEILKRFPPDSVLTGITFSETDKEHAIFFRVKK